MSISRNGPIALQYPGSHAQFIQWERRRGELSLFRFARSPAAAGRRGDQNVKRRLRFEQLLQRRLIQHLHPPSASTTTAMLDLCPYYIFGYAAGPFACHQRAHSTTRTFCWQAADRVLLPLRG